MSHRRSMFNMALPKPLNILQTGFATGHGPLDPSQLNPCYSLFVIHRTHPPFLYAGLMALALTGCAGPKQVDLQPPSDTSLSQTELDVEACKKLAAEKVADVDRFGPSTNTLREAYGAAYLLDRMMDSVDADARRRLWTQSCMQDKGYR